MWLHNIRPYHSSPYCLWTNKKREKEQNVETHSVHLTISSNPPSFWWLPCLPRSRSAPLPSLASCLLHHTCLPSFLKYDPCFPSHPSVFWGIKILSDPPSAAPCSQICNCYACRKVTQVLPLPKTHVHGHAHAHACTLSLSLSPKGPTK